MSMYINTMLGESHRDELVREAAAWRRRREAKHAASPRRKAERTASPNLYCVRAAASGLTAAPGTGGDLRGAAHGPFGLRSAS